MKRYDVITLLDFGDKRFSTKIGSFFKTRKSGCYKLDLDYVPSDSDAPLLIIVGNKSDENSDSIFVLDWAFEGAIKSHSVYGFMLYGMSDDSSERKRHKLRIGSIFRTQNHHVYCIKLNLLPTKNVTDMLCFEVDVEEAMQQTQPVID